MAVQAAVSSSVQDFFQVQSSARTDVCPQEGVSPDGGASQEFKKLLLSMRQAKRVTSGEDLADNKNPAPVVMKNAVPSGDTAALFEAEITENGEPAPEKNAAAVPEERAASRFDPDVILGAPSETESVKYADGAESAADENENMEDAEKEKSGEENPPAAEPAPVEIPIVNVHAAETVFEAAPAAEEPAKETAAAAEPLPNEYEYESGEKPAAADIPKFAGDIGEPAVERAAEDVVPADIVPSDIGAARRADVSGPREENSGKTEPAPNEGPGKARRNAGDNAAGPGEKAVSRRETSQTKDSPEKSEKSPLQPAVSDGAQAGRAYTAEVRSAHVPAVYSLRSGNKFGEGLASVVELMNRDGLPEARIVVEPPALGRIDVALRTTSNGVEALFRVENEELRQMVQFQLDSLKTSLHAQGIHVSALAVDIRNNEGQKGRYPGAPKKGRRMEPADGGDDIAETRIARLDLENGLLHWVA